MNLNLRYSLQLMIYNDLANRYSINHNNNKLMKLLEMKYSQLMRELVKNQFRKNYKINEIKINLQKAGFKKETIPSDNVSFLLFKSVSNCLSYVSLRIYAS